MSPRPAYSMMWEKSVYEIYRLRGLRLGTESSLAAPEGINTTPSENCIQEERFNQNILQDQPKDGNKTEAPVCKPAGASFACSGAARVQVQGGQTL